MKKNVKNLSLLFALLLTGTMVTPVNAATSNASVEFIAPTAAPEILNPDNPNEDATSGQIEEGSITNEVGVLTLDFASNFVFGENELSATAESYNLLNVTTPFVQVTDVRGTGEGWRLTASLSGFTESAQPSLPGAKILLANTTVVASDENTSALNTPTTEIGTIVLTSDNTEINITTATEPNRGMGTWLTRWQDDDADISNGNANVTLEIPASVARTGNHNAKITWTLYDTPTE